MSELKESATNQLEGEVLLLEPFYGGSHRQLVDLLESNIPGCVLLTLPPSKWHWRARTAALSFAFQIPHEHDFKVLFASSVLNLAEVIALRPDLSKLKKVLYFHENQLVYPVRKQQDRDFQYGYNQIISCLVADVVVFNSYYNRDSFLSAIDSFLKLMPDRPRKVADRIRPKCQVLYFPVDFPDPSSVSKITTLNSKCTSAGQSPCFLCCGSARMIVEAGKYSTFEKNLSVLSADWEDGHKSDEIATDLLELCQVDPDQHCKARLESQTCDRSNMDLCDFKHKANLQSLGSNPQCSPYPWQKQTHEIVSVVESSTLCRCDNEQRCLCIHGDQKLELSSETTLLDTDKNARTSCREDPRADEIADLNPQHFYCRSNKAHCQRELNKCILDEAQIRSGLLNEREYGRHSHGEEESLDEHHRGSKCMQYPFSGFNCMKNCGCHTSEESNSNITPLHILWPHRWEHDKNPDLFFSTLFNLHDEGYDFKLSVLGESYQEIPVIFTDARCKLKEHILHWGYQPSKDDYHSVLARADVVVSTADHEFFGVAMLEAIHFGCYPLCPNRLVYPEIYQAEYLYRTPTQLLKRLKKFCSRPHLARNHNHNVELSNYSWMKLRVAYHQLLIAT